MAIVARQHKSGIVYWVVFTWEKKPVWERVGGEKREAERMNRRRLAEVRSGTYVPPSARRATTNRQYLRDWLKKRTNRSREDERRWIENYVLTRPWFADESLMEIRPRHLMQLIAELKTTVSLATGKTLAGKSISNIYGVLRTAYRDATIAEMMPSDPCVLPHGMFARKARRRPAPYSADEAKALIRCEKLPPDERIWIALAFLTGMREGEVCGRRWKDWARDGDPLGAIEVHSQYDDQPLKTDDGDADRPRMVPVHPDLAGALTWWWSVGFELVFCRKPTLEDFVVPHRKGKAHTKSTAYKMWRRACVAAGVENRTLHSTRRTFISLARRGGARKDVVEKITHNAAGDIVDLYTTWDWAPLCEAVLAMGGFDSNFDQNEIDRENWWRRRESKPARSSKRRPIKSKASDDDPSPGPGKRGAVGANDAEPCASQSPAPLAKAAVGLVVLRSLESAFDRLWAESLDVDLPDAAGGSR